MGCFNVTCGFTDLPITYETPIRMMAIRFRGEKEGNAMIDSLDCFEPVSILARGTYNDYGWIEWAEGEEARFFESATTVGISIVKPENGNPELPAGVFLWFIREDAFALAGEMPFEVFGGDVTVEQSIEKGKENFHKWREIEAKPHDDATPLNFTLRFAVEDAAKGSLVGRAHNMRTYLMIAAKRSTPQGDQALIDLFDHQRVIAGLDSINRPLMPTRCGYQCYLNAAYVKLGAFYDAAVKEDEERWA